MNDKTFIRILELAGMDTDKYLSEQPVAAPAAAPTAAPAPAAPAPAAQAGTWSMEHVINFLRSKYPNFVKNLGKNITDQKFVNFLSTITDEDKVQFTDMDIPVTQLRPTQREIDVGKSLFYPLTKPESTEQCLRGGTIAIMGNKIVTSNGGKYIIDGHHRWSQIYVINPKAKVAAADMTNVDSPASALKIAQIAIAQVTKDVPHQPVKGSNLLQMGQEPIMNYINKTLTDGSLQVFNKYGFKDRNAVIQYVLKNVAMMQKNNQPMPGASRRDFMPQTDTASNWEQYASNEPLRRMRGATGYQTP